MECVAADLLSHILLAADGPPRQPQARYINHSCDPNCTARVATVKGRKRVVFLSLRAILTGEELTYDYRMAREISHDAWRTTGSTGGGCFLSVPPPFCVTVRMSSHRRPPRYPPPGARASRIAPSVLVPHIEVQGLPERLKKKRAGSARGRRRQQPRRDLRTRRRQEEANSRQRTEAANHIAFLLVVVMLRGLQQTERTNHRSLPNTTRQAAPLRGAG